MWLKLGTLLSWFCKIWKVQFLVVPVYAWNQFLFFIFSTNWLVILLLLQIYMTNIGATFLLNYYFHKFQRNNNLLTLNMVMGTRNESFRQLGFRLCYYATIWYFRTWHGMRWGSFTCWCDRISDYGWFFVLDTIECLVRLFFSKVCG